MSVPDITVTVVYTILTLALADLIRLPARRFLNPGLAQTAILEAIGTFELCAVCYEIGLVANLYGVYVYAVFLFLATIWWSYRWTVSACPYIHFEHWLAGDIDWMSGLLLVFTQLLGGSLFYRFYLKYLWSLEYGVGHINRAHQQHQCSADIHVVFWVGALIEATAVFLQRLISRMVSQINRPVAIVINAFVGTTLVVIAMSTTGGYFNPALATALQFQCSGATLFEHLSVYWIGDTIGSILAFALWQNASIRQLFVTDRPKQD